MFGGFDTLALKQHYGKKLMELEEEKKVVQVAWHYLETDIDTIYLCFFLKYDNRHVFLIVQQERDRLFAEVENLAANSDGQGHKLHDNHLQKLKALEAQVTLVTLYHTIGPSPFFGKSTTVLFKQILELKKKQENQVQLLKQKQRSDEAAKKLQEEIQFIKAQKVVIRSFNNINQNATQICARTLIYYLPL